MKIYGPYTRKDGRKHVVIIDDNGNRTTKSYPRYVYEQHHNVVLSSDVTVDHIDEDFTNDDPKNLQLLSLADNAKKSTKPAEVMEFKCPQCHEIFEGLARQYRHNQEKQGKAGPFCGRSCAGRYNQRAGVDQ